jgi:predicted permease
MDTILILAKQITIMFLLMALGWIMAKGGLLTPQGAKDLSHLLLRFVVPAIIIQSFLVERTPERVHDFFWSFVLSFLVISFSVLVSKVLFRRPGHVIDHFGSAFCNAGFFGIPLVQAFLGEEPFSYGFFCMMIFSFKCTYGVYQFPESFDVPFSSIDHQSVLIAFLIA